MLCAPGHRSFRQPQRYDTSWLSVIPKKQICCIFVTLSGAEPSFRAHDQKRAAADWLATRLGILSDIQIRDPIFNWTTQELRNSAIDLLKIMAIRHPVRFFCFHNINAYPRCYTQVSMWVKIIRLLAAQPSLQHDI